MNVLNVVIPGIILYSFLHADDNPTVAIITAALIGLGIVFSGAAVVHNVFVWQRVSRYRTDVSCVTYSEDVHK